MSKTCKDCRHFKIHGTNSVCTEFCNETTMYDDCKNFEQPTVFDQITQSPEVLAPKFVYHVTSFLDGLDKPKKIWYSTLINNQYFNTELEAKRATVAKLKEIA